MGRYCGFLFYKLKDDRLVEEQVIAEEGSDGPLKDNCLWFNGRCEATDIFLEAVARKSSPRYLKEEMKPEEKYTPYLLLNHPELDGFEVHQEESKEFNSEWFKKYFKL